MRRTLLFFVIMPVPAGSAHALPQLKDFAGLKDPALFTRMPNFFMPGASSLVDKQFDAYQFLVKGAKAVERKQVEGHLVTYKYVLDRSKGAAPSGLQIMRNYQAAAAALGGKVIHEDQYRTTILISKGGKETWVEVAPVPAGYEYSLRILERQAMQQDVVADAAAFQAGLSQSGHVEVPGIYFDTGKSEVKPESEPALKEVAKLLQSDPALKVWIVGHTDNSGPEELNVSLSQARAAAVGRALTQQMGVAPARLAAHGAGPYAPVAENKSEEGRAKNRRVELVSRP